jgi:hypothetical protein
VAPHISHDFREGWLIKVHLGQVEEDGARLFCVSLTPPSICCPSFEKVIVGVAGVSVSAIRGEDKLRSIVVCAIASLSMSKGGTTPQAKHGGQELAVADAALKFDGTGFENEQKGHIHVSSLKGNMFALPAEERVASARPSTEPSNSSDGTES